MRRLALWMEELAERWTLGRAYRRHIGIYYSVFLLSFNVVLFIQNTLDGGTILPHFYLTPDTIEEKKVYISFLSVLLSNIIIIYIFEKRALGSLGLNIDHRSFLLLLGGTTLGAVALIIVYSLSLLQQGWWLQWPYVSLKDTWSFLAKSLRIFVGAFTEELFYRGYLFQTASRLLGTMPALSLTSLIFAISHLTVGIEHLPMITFVRGLLYGVAYWKSRSLWFPLGLHFGWNWFANGGSWEYQIVKVPWLEKKDIEKLSSIILETLIDTILIIVLLLIFHSKSQGKGAVQEEAER